MGFRHWKWYEFPLVVKYGESGMVMHLNKEKMVYRNEVEGILGTVIHCKLFIEKPELFTQMNSNLYRHRVIVEQRPVVINWCIGEQPESKGK
jgi:hypothetical protein